jgi:hypothetical protein
LVELEVCRATRTEEIFAACPEARYRDGNKAIENAAKALEILGHNEFGPLVAAAAAYPELGDFESACE